MIITLGLAHYNNLYFLLMWYIVILFSNFVSYYSLFFFFFFLQRVALATAANMCRKLPSDASDFVMEAVPLLTNLLNYHDSKVLFIFQTLIPYDTIYVYDVN